MEIIPEATPSNATFSDATPSDAVKETPPDGFYTDRRESLYYRKDGETVKSAWIYEDDHWYYAGSERKDDSRMGTNRRSLVFLFAKRKTGRWMDL